MTHSGSNEEEGFYKSKGRLQVGETNLQVVTCTRPQPQLKPECMSSDTGEIPQLQPFLSLGG